MIKANSGWTSRTVATEPSPYLQLVNSAVMRYSTCMKGSSLHRGASSKPLWRGAMAWLSTELLEGLASIMECSEEGRSQMLLDVQSVALLCETESGIR